MALTSKIRLTNFNNFISNYTKICLSEIEVYSANNKINITSIIAYNSLPVNADSLRIPGNTDIVEITSDSYNTNRSLFYIEINLDTTIDSAFNIYIRLKGLDIIYWPFKFDIQYFNGAVFILDHTQINNNPPGVGIFTEIPTVSTGYINKSTQWDASTHNSNIDIDANGIEYTKLANNYSVIRTANALSSGKYYFEVYETIEDLNNHSGRIGLCNTSFDPVPIRWLGQDGAGDSFGFSNDRVYYTGSYDGGRIKTELSINGTSNVISYSGFWGNAQTKKYAVLIDLDNRTFELRHLYSAASVKVKIPWAGPVYACYGYGDSVSPYNLGYVNFGYKAFIGQIPNEYQPGYSADPIVLANLGIVENVDFRFADNGTKLSTPPGALPITTTVTHTVKNALIQNLNTMSIDEYAEFNKDVTWSTEVKTTLMLGSYGGFGYIKSNVLKGTDILVPIKTAVILVELDTYNVILSTYSDPDTGEFEFKYISEWRYYNILAFDPDRGWVTAIGGPFKPTRMPNTEGATYIEI